MNDKNLDDFRTSGLVNAFGKDGFDIQAWELNNLPYVVVDDEWRSIYKMLQIMHRGIDCFSRGANEIIQEMDGHPYLDVEKGRVFVYDRDSRFHPGKSAAKYKEVINSSLNTRPPGLARKIPTKKSEILQLIGFIFPCIFPGHCAGCAKTTVPPASDFIPASMAPVPGKLGFLPG